MSSQTREQAIRKAIAETPDGEELREQALQLALENTRLRRMLKQSVESVGECAGTVEISFEGKGKTRKMMLTACCSGDDKALADAFVKAWSDFAQMDVTVREERLTGTSAIKGGE